MIPPDAPIGRMTCFDCHASERCTGECKARRFSFALVAFLASSAWLAVIGILTVFSWFL
ncbi:MAG: hypothetical protein ACK53Z_02880 [Betaproteobacteria bacterium]|jgi:hypothetical protein